MLRMYLNIHFEERRMRFKKIRKQSAFVPRTHKAFDHS